jgi:DNA-binding transcriptional MerR regulator
LEKAPDAFRTISEVADEIDVPQHVLRFWEGRFPQIRPMKRGGGRRYYRPDDVDLLRGIRHLLYGEGYTIRGVQRILREHGAGFVQNVWRAGAEPLPPEREEDRQGAELAAGEEQNSFAFSGLHDEERAANVGAAKVGAVKSGAAKPPALRAATPENRGKLQAALDELLTCRRIIDGALRED